MSTPLRAVRSAQGLAASAPKTAVRSLHITGAHAQPSSIAFQNRMAEIDRKSKPTPKKPAKDARPFNTTRALQKPNDSSPIDMVYFPQADAPDVMAQRLPQIPLAPMLPDNLMPGRAQHLAMATEAPIHRHEISTTEPDGIEVGRVAILGESDTKGEAADDAGDLVGSMNRSVKNGTSELRRVWNGFVDDLVGATTGKLA